MEHDRIQKSIFMDMSEGVMLIRFDGVIELVNRAVLTILGKTEQELMGRSFAQAFFQGEEENDEFIQIVLDAVYERETGRESYTPYRTARGVKQLRVVSSCLHEGESVRGVILVISDITELTEMRDAVRAMKKIQQLNRQLELRNRVLQETFGRYLSDEVVREILNSPDGWRLGGQRRNLTVMMSDLRGFTALSERMAPQDLITMLNHFFGEMYEVIERYHGTLIEFIGDGMLVVFGAPTWTETHAADAVAAAVGMQKRLEQVNRWNEERGYEPISMGIGINTDEIIIGNIGSEKRTKYGVLGAAVNLTGRIEGYTTAGQILIAPNTRAAVKSELTIRQTLPITPKGVKEEILLYDVAGIGAPYGLYLDTRREPLYPLPQPGAVRFSLVDKKFVQEEKLAGRILALSMEEAVLASESELHLYDNLCIDVGEGLYAKVVGTEEEAYRISFTAKPPVFEQWCRELGRDAARAAEGEARDGGH